ncbi:beta-ketoacyl synthase N-terminal-like domain-containing protein [Streptomyces xanthophaeus]|uniref:beta-ketoacyl synthase N-terminal-like domain-containing protein n=1 Tax=Streptomyces xanthophaeus TaxID=67385 RepID=UPI00399038C9
MIHVYAPAMSSCFGDFDETLRAMHEGRRGTRALIDIAGFEIPGVAVVYADPSIEVPYVQRTAEHLRRALRQTLRELPPLDPHRTAVVLCTGLGATPGDEADPGVSWSSVEDVARAELGPDVDVYSITNACSASGMGLALGSDLMRTGTYDHVILAAADSMTRAMLTMIGKVAAEPAQHCAPFEEKHAGAVLGEGAATCLLSLDDAWPGLERFGTVSAIECSSDANHPTAPDQRTIEETVHRAIARAGLTAGDLDFVVPHGTGTTLNDECEIAVYSAMPELTSRAVFLPLKGGLGHTSGASFLMSLLTGMAVTRGTPPPGYVPGTTVEGAGALRWRPDASWTPRRGLVCAYGFGGANAVGVIAA